MPDIGFYIPSSDSKTLDWYKLLPSEFMMYPKVNPYTQSSYCANGMFNPADYNLTLANEAISTSMIFIG